MSLIKEIALEMSIQTGQVYTCPAENLIQAADHAYHVRIQSWTNRLAAEFTGPKNESPFKTDTITLDPKRNPEALARDILRRLPPNQAIEFYSKATEYINKKAEEERVYEETRALFESLGFKQYWHDRAGEKFYNGESCVHFHPYKATEVKLSIEKLTPAQAIQLIQLAETMKKGA